MTPALVERAAALARHVQYLGAPLEQFVVPATPEEAFEALTWLRVEWENARCRFDFELLDKDIARAEELGDPWHVLAHFTVHGMHIVPRGSMH